MPTQSEIAKSIIDRLRIVDPDLNTGLGSPVRKIIDAVSSEISMMATDQYVMSYQFDLESFSGTDLDAFVQLFGFSRQRASIASGSLLLTRDDGDVPLYIAPGTQFYRPATTTTPAVYFQTITFERMDEGELSVELPIRAVNAGSLGNVPANTITEVAGGYFGVVNITNPLPTAGGRDIETDSQLRERFKKTIFRNVAGTEDQYLGLALSHALVGRALLVGQVSKNNEILTVVNHAATSANTEVASLLDAVHGVWLRDVETEDFFHQSTDFTVASNPPTVSVVEAMVTDEYTTLVGTQPNQLEPMGYTASPLTVEPGSVVVTNEAGDVTYVEDEDYVVDYSNGTIARTGDSSIPDGGNVLVDYHYWRIPEGSVVRFEYDYLSTINRGAGRNVELYVDGEDSIQATDVHFIDTTKTFGANNANWIRTDGITNPVASNVFVPLASQPVLSLPAYIEFGSSVVLEEGTHYWLVRDISKNFGSAKAQDGIEFDADALVTANIISGTAFSLDYMTNRVVSAIQDLVNKHTPVATDALVHAAKKRYFKVHVTVMYSVFPRDSVNNLIEDALEDYFRGLPLGATIQLSDIETTVAKVSGVDSVRVTTSDDNAGAYGIEEYAEDGVTKLGDTRVKDFKLSSNEVPVLMEVVEYSRTQETW